MNSKIFRFLLKTLVLLVKIILGLLLVLFFVVGVPLIIDWLYDFPKPIFYTEWGPSELLDYYGSLLGTAVTVLTFYFGIRNEFLKNRKETITQRRIEAVDRLIGLCDELMMKSLPSKFLMLHQFSRASDAMDKEMVFDLYKRAIPFLDEANSSINNFGTSLDTLKVVGLDNETLSCYQKQIMDIQKATKEEHEEVMIIYWHYAKMDDEQRRAERQKLLNTIDKSLEFFAEKQRELVQIQGRAMTCLLSFKSESIQELGL